MLLIHTALAPETLSLKPGSNFLPPPLEKLSIQNHLYDLAHPSLK